MTSSYGSSSSELRRTVGQRRDRDAVRNRVSRGGFSPPVCGPLRVVPTCQRPAAARRALTFVLLLAVVACAEASNPAALAPSDGAGTVDARGAVVVRGVARSAGDVGDLPDPPFTGGAVFALPARRSPELWAAAGLPSPQDPGRARVVVEQATLVDLGATVGPLGPDGAFALELRPGRHTVCLALGEDRLRTLGCAEDDVAGDRMLLVTFGEEGVRLPRR